jgi:polynucleotide kinase-phosphatase
MINKGLARRQDRPPFFTRHSPLATEPRMQLTIPELSLVLLVGPSGCGKSTFARRHFAPTEILSSDFFRGMVCDDQGNQAASRPAFDLLHQAAARRMEWRRFTVIDATNIQAEGRKPLLELARRYHYLTAAIVFDLDEAVCQAHNRARPDRLVPSRVISGQMQNLRRSLHALEKEGIRKVFVLRSLQDVEAVSIRRVPLWTDRRPDCGPFDIIGDIHGCFHELVDLLERLGYQLVHQPDDRGLPGLTAFPPPGRRAFFVGDLGDRGPDTPSVYRLVMNMVGAGNALCVMGNHDNKLLRHLHGKSVKPTHGLAETLAQLEPEPREFQARMRDFLEDLVSHYVLDEGRLVVAHAGLREDLQGRASGQVRSFALYGDTTGETDEQGLPVRRNWAAEYRGSALVIYGHTPVARLAWLNNTLNIDTGCVFGGALTALRYPERELVSVPARRQYCDYGRPFLLAETEAEQTPQHQVDDQLDLSDVTGKRVVETRLLGPVTVRAEQAAAALEVMSRFAANPKWLIYLPPTMSPSETSREAGYLEHPAEALAYFRNQGLEEVICQEKHMGSRAVVILCRDEGAARRAFGVEDEGRGIVLTRTGRRFFDEPLEQAFLDALGSALDASRFWETHSTDWVCLDCELMPWSAKAQELLRSQYAAVGAAARSALAEVNGLLAAARCEQPGLAGLAERFRNKAEAAEGFVAAYRRYCWPVESVRDLRLAPFHLLATRTGVHADRPHPWHLEQLAPLLEAGAGLVVPTRSLRIRVREPADVQRGLIWWHELTEQGGEGMVVKPLDFIARGSKGLIQPALKCRGREYLRIIYGPDYLEPENLERLRQRGLSAKRGLALREFSLGLEGLERFARQEPLRRVHECSFAVLALESEPVDPRL